MRHGKETDVNPVKEKHGTFSYWKIKMESRMKSKRTPARIQKLGYLTPDLGFPVRLVISDSEPEFFLNS
jgi:hypothetical protein